MKTQPLTHKELDQMAHLERYLRALGDEDKVVTLEAKRAVQARNRVRKKVVETRDAWLFLAERHNQPSSRPL